MSEYNIEKFIQKIADIQAFEPKDALSNIVNEYSFNDELQAEELDLVVAASGNAQTYLKCFKDKYDIHM